MRLGLGVSAPEDPAEFGKAMWSECVAKDSAALGSYFMYSSSDRIIESHFVFISTRGYTRPPGAPGTDLRPAAQCPPCSASPCVKYFLQVPVSPKKAINPTQATRNDHDLYPLRHGSP